MLNIHVANPILKKDPLPYGTYSRAFCIHELRHVPRDRRMCLQFFDGREWFNTTPDFVEFLKKKFSQIGVNLTV